MHKYQYTEKELQEIINDLQLSAYWTTSGYQIIRKLSVKMKFPVLSGVRIKEIKIGYEQRIAPPAYRLRNEIQRFGFSLPDTERAALYIMGYICYYGRQGDLSWIATQNGWSEEYVNTVEKNYVNPTLIAKIDHAINQAIGQGPAQAIVKKVQTKKVEMAESTKIKRLRKMFESHDFEEEQVLNLLRESQIHKIQNE